MSRLTSSSSSKTDRRCRQLAVASSSLPSKPRYYPTVYWPKHRDTPLGIFGALAVGNISVILVGVGHGHHGFADGSTEVCKLRVAAALGDEVGASAGADATQQLAKLLF